MYTDRHTVCVVHNVRTIDGKNTFHGMGVISVTIAEGNFNDEWSLCTSRIPRTNSRIDVGYVTKHVGIPLVMHNKNLDLDCRHCY